MNLHKVDSLVITQKKGKSLTLNEDELNDLCSILREIMPRGPVGMRIPLVANLNENQPILRMNDCVGNKATGDSCLALLWD